MTDQNLTEIIAIVDRSGSMSACRNDAIGGFNAMLAEQQQLDVGRCRLTYVQFDHEYDFVHKSKPIQDVPELTWETYVPRGWTALLDAVGRTIQDTGTRFARLPEHKRPGQVVVVILTDGLENDSKEFTKAQVKRMIEHQTHKYNWQFLYLGANQDAFEEAEQLGIQANFTANVAHDAFHVGYATVSRGMSAYRATNDASSLCLDDEITAGTLNVPSDAVDNA